MKSRRRSSTIQWTLTILLLVVVVLSTLPLGSNRPVSWILLALIVTVLFAVQITVDFREKLPPQAQGLLLPMILFFAATGWAAVQVIHGVPDTYAHPSWLTVENGLQTISADPGQGRHGILRYTCYAMIFWISFRCAVSTDRASFLLKGFALFSGALAMFGMYAAVTGQNIFLVEGGQNRAVTASFVNRNNYATYAIFGVLANLAAYFHSFKSKPANKDRWESHTRDVLERFFSDAWIFSLGALICLTSLGLTQSRAGAISGVIGVIVFAIVWQGRRRRRNPWLLATLGVVIAFVALTNASDLTSRLLTTSGENGRFLVYPHIVAGILDRPLLGHGLGAFHDSFAAYVPVQAAVGEWVRGHNSFLENIFELGLPAAVAFYAALGLAAYRIRQGSRQRRSNRAFSCFAFACIVAAAMHSMFDFSLQIPAVAAAFSMILGIGWAQSYRHGGK